MKVYAHTYKKVSTIFSIIIFLACCSSLSYGEEVVLKKPEPVSIYPATQQYSFPVDKGMSARAGSDWTLSLIEFYRANENNIFHNKTTLDYLLKTGLRYFIAAESSIIQHEIFGHGSRGREFKEIKIEDYNVGLFHGSVSYRYKINTPIQKRIIFNLGGIEGTHVLAEKIKNRFFADGGVINPVYGISYFVSQMDQIEYSFSEFQGDGHDIKAYIDTANDTYGKDFLTEDKVRRAAALSMLDPFLFFSFYSFITNKDVSISMFDILGVRYLPALRAVFTPYGIETKLLNHFVKGNMYGQVNISYGDNNSQKSYSLETKLYNLWQIGKFTFNAEFSLWKQPELFTANPVNAKNKLGGSLNVISEYTISKNIKGFAALGYKTKGYQPGFPAEKTPLLQLGITVVSS